MYETQALPSGLTHDEVWRIEDAVVPSNEGTTEFEQRLAEITRDSVVIGGALGRSGWPGPGWVRLRWSELGVRLGIDPYALDVPPCFRSFPYRSWPVNIAPPAEGSLDREQFNRLLVHLAAMSDDGWHTECTCYYSPLWSGGTDPTVYAGKLEDLAELYEAERTFGAPTNLWPNDRSWLTYTDADLWGTKVSGSGALTKCVLDDDEIEAVTLDL
jgi:hypothetical protein